MKWIATLALLFTLAGWVQAAGTDDQYLDILGQILQADSLQQDNKLEDAALKYRDAQAAMLAFKAEHSGFNEEMVKFRLDYLADKMNELAHYLPSGNNAAAAVSGTAANQQLELSSLQEEVSALTAANEQLQLKLKEALSVQPAAVAPSQLAKLKDENVRLEKERDLLQVSLDKLKAAAAAPSAPAPSVLSVSNKLASELASVKAQAAKESKADKSQIADLETRLGDTKKSLASVSAELDTYKSRPTADVVKQLTSERDQLKKDLAARSRELADAEAHANSASSTSSEQAAKLKALQQERDNLAKQVAALSKTSPARPGADAALAAENTSLRAQLAALQAPAVPLTAEELAAIQSAPSAVKPSQMPTNSMTLAHKAHSARDLPPGAGQMMADGMRAEEEEHNYAQAEAKFKEVLAQDPDNVYVLVHLAQAQLAENHLEDCEKNASHAVALDSGDAGALYMLGVLRCKQEKWDEALDSLSRSASVNSTNAGTQFYLGYVLAAKGLRPQAETALRTALTLDPLYADAHYNLALLYAGEEPPSLALAKFHYQKAVALGHPANSDFEKRLGISP